MPCDCKAYGNPLTAGRTALPPLGRIPLILVPDRAIEVLDMTTYLAATIDLAAGVPTAARRDRTSLAVCGWAAVVVRSCHAIGRQTNTQQEPQIACRDCQASTGPSILTALAIDAVTAKFWPHVHPGFHCPLSPPYDIQLLVDKGPIPSVVGHITPL